MKSLYFLHIPKTMGLFVQESITPILSKNNIPFYTNNQQPHDVDFTQNAFIGCHIGRYPIENVPGIDVAVMVRNPVDRSVSHFNYIHDIMLSERKEYSSISNYIDRLKFYLFEDPNFINQRNIQSRFICNSPDSRIFNTEEYYLNEISINNNERTKQGGFTWFISNDKTSLDFAKSQIDSFKIVNTSEDLNLFMLKINNWFNENYNLSIPYDTSVVINESIVSFDGNDYKTSDLISMLSNDEINQIVNNNTLDNEIYKYIVSKK
jgi:hypothetical protein